MRGAGLIRQAGGAAGGARGADARCPSARAISGRPPGQARECSAGSEREFIFISRQISLDTLAGREYHR